MSSSSSSSVTPAQLIDQILKTNTDKPDLEDLTRLIQQIDDLLARYAAQPEKKNPIREKLGDLPSASGASNFAEQVSTNVKQIAEEIKQFSGNTHETSIKVLNAIGNIHWVAVGFSIVGAALEIVDTIKNNKEELLRLLKSMVDLSKIIVQLQGLHLHEEFQNTMKESIHLIVRGAISCCFQNKRKGAKRILKASRDKQELEQLNRAMDDMYKRILLQINTSTYRKVQNKDSPPPSVPPLNNDAVGIEEKIEKVIQQLDWESDSTTVAVVIWGIGGSGKTTLADSVYSSLKDKLQGWKHSRVTLIQNLEKDPKVEELQSFILEDLTGTKDNVRDFQSGCQKLRDIIEKESIFLYIDNALYLEPLKKLLPKDVTNAKKFRLLLTAREANVSGIIESCGVEHCKLYDVESLPIDAAIQVLCKQIDRKGSDKAVILEKRPQLRKIAEKCSCCPLFLEVIGAYLHMRKDKAESYDRALQWLEPGDDFGGIKKYNFDDSRVLFSYNELEQSAKEAFLDICSFFSSWNWEEVSYIVGEEDMLCLQEGALIKKESEKIKIHDLILSAGRNKSRDNRIKNAKDFSLTLKNKELASQVRGVWIEDLKSPLHISAEELDSMSQSLRVFYLGAQRLTIMKGKCSKQFDKLRFLHVKGGVSNLPMNIFNLNHLRYLSIVNFLEDVVLSPDMNLPNLNVLKLYGRRIHGIAEIAHLRSLKQLKLWGCGELEELPESLARLRSLQKLDLSRCTKLKRLPAAFGELVNLTELNLSEFGELEELPESLARLRSLQKLDLSWCRKLKRLPAAFGELVNLTELKLHDCGELEELPESLARLRSLQKLDLSWCRKLKRLPAAFGELVNLTELKLYDCGELEELPESLARLRSLQKLDLSECCKLKRLPAAFGELVNLTELHLSRCQSLQELPCDLEKLTSLQSLNIRGCSTLLYLPAGLGSSTSLTSFKIDGRKSLTCIPHGLISVWGCEINFDSCSSLIEIPEEICKQTMLTRISLRDCRRLKTLPIRFGELTCLQHLDLSRCDSIQELCDDFHCLGGLKSLQLSDCKSLSTLPLEFGKLSSLETLDLSGCDKLEDLGSNFHCLVALKHLNLSKCDNLRNLPDHFGELGCLETLEISGCSNLVKLSDDFHLLQSLTRLNLSKCESLGGEWMDRVENMRGLWRLDIDGSERLIQRWMEMKSQKERNMVVVADSPPSRGEESKRALLLEVVLSKVFDEEGLLVDADEHPFHSSSLQPQTPLILIIDEEYDGWSRKSLGKKVVQQLQRISKDLQIIYVGTHFNSFKSESAVRILAYTPHNSRTSSFYHKLSSCFGTSDATYGNAVFRSTDQLEDYGVKGLSTWEDISELDELALFSITPRESNFELLKELLITEETDYLLLNGNSQVKVAALQGKLILLLVTFLDEDLEAVIETYLKFQQSHDYVVELVWIPIRGYNNSWEEFERAAAKAPWPVVPNPWLIQRRIESFLGTRKGRFQTKMPCVCVVDEKGRISNKNAFSMIERWGVDAYPFSEAREAELRKAEWEGLKVNSLSSLQFVLQNLEFLSCKAKEMMDRGAMMFFCVGSPEKMMELVPQLNCALTLMLEMDFRIFYVAHSGIAAKDYDMACEKLKEHESEMCSIANLSFSDIKRFCRRVEHLQNDLTSGMGTDERIVKVRRMVLGLASADWNSGILLVGGNGEMVSGRGMELVKELCDGEEESKSKLVEEIKKGGVEKSVESRWRDGIIHPRHHPQHPLLPIMWKAYGEIPVGASCCLCGLKQDWVRYYQCSVCEKYVICRDDCTGDDKGMR